MELTIFALLILIELGFLVTSLIKKNNFKKQKAIAWICFSIIFSLLLLSPIIDWSIKWMMLTTILIIQTIFCINSGNFISPIWGEVSTNPPYPKPILNIYNEKHYEEAQNSTVYPNKAATNNATESYEVVIEGSGHMNFTDLAIVSPILSNKLELGSPGTVDPRYCIETTNEVILEFFDRYLKNDATEIVKERTY